MRLIDAERLCENCKDFPQCKGEFKAECAVYVEVAAQPTIDPASLRPKGEWIMRGGKLYCSHCGERAGVARDREDFWYTKGTDACPNCGADMRGDTDE